MARARATRRHGHTGLDGFEETTEQNPKHTYNFDQKYLYTETDQADRQTNMYPTSGDIGIDSEMATV